MMLPTARAAQSAHRHGTRSMLLLLCECPRQSRRWDPEQAGKDGARSLTQVRLVVHVRQRRRDQDVLLAILWQAAYVPLGQLSRKPATTGVLMRNSPPERIRTVRPHVLPAASRKSRSSMPARMLRDVLASGAAGNGEAMTSDTVKSQACHSGTSGSTGRRFSQRRVWGS